MSRDSSGAIPSLGERRSHRPEEDASGDVRAVARSPMGTDLCPDVERCNAAAAELAHISTLIAAVVDQLVAGAGT
jgi:hypothetical protein